MARPQRAPASAAWLGPLLLVALAGGVQQYSRLDHGQSCSDYHLSNVANATECFNAAASFLSLASVPTIEFDGLGFEGCVYNSYANTLMFGTSPTVVVIPNYDYICQGIPTTTFTTSSSLTTTTFTETSTITPAPPTTVTITGDMQGYTMILENEGCADYLVQDVTSEEECFTLAAPYVGLGSATTIRLDVIGFTGCVYNTGNNMVFYGEHPGVINTAPVFYRFICRGEATTTTTTTATTTSTETTSTSTQTTATTSTSTQTTSTQTTSTMTSSTSTLTTSTLTTSTITLTTSTVTYTTTTDTGSTSTITTTTTETTSTSTLTTTTSTYTHPPWSGFVGDDPITYYNNVMHKFWLPEGELVPLLRTPELQLLGSAQTIGGEQYIKHLAIRGPADESVLQVAIREGLESFKSGDLAPDAFETLNITLGEWADGFHMASLPGKDAYAHRWQSLAFAFQRLADAQIGEARAEMAVVGGESATILIMSVAASGFDGDLAAKHAHLDFVLQMKRHGSCEGILPELWGVTPMSNQTLALLEPPEPEGGLLSE